MKIHSSVSQLFHAYIWREELYYALSGDVNASTK